ncbi:MULTISPECIES: hypothetical protein [unclassified Nocardia]|uniref:hypothetical protein n=1 Tax=unclassified Nocardia TaxID=2637762 RepID=UPI001CE4655A|nr:MULTISPECIES: hypothetical protein [unclassified Nocardia]
MTKFFRARCEGPQRNAAMVGADSALTNRAWHTDDPIGSRERAAVTGYIGR